RPRSTRTPPTAPLNRQTVVIDQRDMESSSLFWTDGRASTPLGPCTCSTRSKLVGCRLPAGPAGLQARWPWSRERLPFPDYHTQQWVRRSVQCETFFCTLDRYATCNQ